MVGIYRAPTLPISREDQSIIDFLKSQGIPFIVTSTNGGTHVATSFHFREGTGGVGEAIDVRGPSGGVDTQELANIFNAFKSVEGSLAELIYSGPQVSYNIKYGQRVNKYATDGHHNHVHVAVMAKGVVLPVPYNSPEEAMASGKYVACVVMKSFYPVTEGPYKGRWPFYGVTASGKVEGHNIYVPTQTIKSIGIALAAPICWAMEHPKIPNSLLLFAEDGGTFHLKPES